METTSNYYTVTELPLTDEDRKQMTKGDTIGIIVWLFLAVFFLWGSSAKVSYWPFLQICAAVCVLIPILSGWLTNKSLANPKMVITGEVTRKINGEEVMIFLGPEAFDITYAKNVAEIEVSDKVSMHYAKDERGAKGKLLKIERQVVFPSVKEN